MFRLLPHLLIILSSFAIGQNIEYAYQLIPKELLESSNSVIRYENQMVDIPNQSTINVHHTRVITVLNKRGDSDAAAYVHYDDVSRVKSIKVTVYDKIGNEINKFKQRDFKDVSAVDGISLYTDTRLLYLDYTPTSYPYTLVLESETTSKNTMAIPPFYTNEGYYSTTQEKYLEIRSAADLGLKYKSFGASKDIEIDSSPGVLKLSIKNAKAIMPESYSPGFRNVVGRVAIALDSFHLEGVDGSAQDWKIFGKWLYDNLLQESQDLPEETAATIQALVAGVENPVDKARIIYNYVQDKTRYISVQVGIGGWKPMKASQVDKLGYGDCKALTSYTKSLLEAVGVPSYYTILYGGNEKRDIMHDFAGIQGNHAILSIPNNEEYIWLECTDQTVPFGFIAGFTDDRDVLVVKPDGGEIVHTKKYEPSDNFQVIKGAYSLDAKGNAIATVHIESGGLQYGDRYSLVHKDEKDKKKYYYRFWEYLNNVTFDSIELTNDRDNVQFTEDVAFKVSNYASFAGEEMLIPINLLNRYTAIPDRIKDRRLPVTISRGFSDTDEVKITLPEGFGIVAMPENLELETPYGKYSLVFKKESNTTISYIRTFELLEGNHEFDTYGDFRKFMRQVVKNDQQKLVIKKG